MSWRCVRCQKKVYRPRKNAFKYLFVWRYKKKTAELTMDMKKIQDVKQYAVVTHLHCEHPEVEGFAERMKRKLDMPAESEHPLLI